MFLHPFRLEEEISQAAGELRAGLAARRFGAWSEDDEGPLLSFRRLTTRERFEQLAELPEALPNRESLQRWLAALIVERVTWDDRVSAEVARRSVEHGIESLGDDRWSVRALSLEIIRARDERRRAQVAEGLARVAQRASDEAVWWMRRRQGAAQQLGVDGLGWLQCPWRGLSSELVSDLLFSATDEIASDLLCRGGGWQDVLRLGAAMDAREGWPAHLTPRWFRAVFGGWKSIEGLRVDPGPLREPICGASFTRAMARFGASVHRAWAARTGAPFSLASRPFDASEAGYGALFAALLASPAFLRRRLGLGRPTARRQARTMAISMVVALRLDAVRTVFGAQADADAAVEAHARAASRALATSVPPELAGVIPRYDPRSAARLAGALHAARWHQQLVEAFDEDWFDNPKAHEYVASVDVTTRLVLDEEAVREGARALGNQMSEVYGR